ncbi:type II toxin-antitoxin system ParD family antitoxin [Cribrihabitans neustonicus]|uniref:type II toxin-antitoxin system ParD family antitoxin n=1 Tax=Cribrihabitans neustonicus TaxID=1429085 RepID=UPI003B5C89DC
MSVKASISLTEAQEAFARSLVAEGRYASLSAVMQQGLELLRLQAEAAEADTQALRNLIEERRAGGFTSVADGRGRTAAMLASKKTQYDLPG